MLDISRPWLCAASAGLCWGLAVGSAWAQNEAGEQEPQADTESPATTQQKPKAGSAASARAGGNEVPEPGNQPDEQAASAEPSSATRAEQMAEYQRVLRTQKLAAAAPLSRPRLREELSQIELMIEQGRRDEAIGNLVYLIESPRFKAFAASDEGRNARYLLGEALGRAGAYEPARGYLKPLLQADPNDIWFRRAARSLVDFGLESETPEVFVEDLRAVPGSAPPELLGDISYLKGRAAERNKDKKGALAHYARVNEKSRFWAQATYLSGLIEVESGDLKKGEQLFCKVAEPKQTPRLAPVFGGSDFFRVRDLARLGLGRVAHEQYRFDDARYYYYLVPKDSDHLPEALYETATTRYEAQDYDGAREAMDELKALDRHHPYEDEAYILDAYIDLATCRFPSADKKLDEFLKRYIPVRNAARRLAGDDAAIKELVEAVRTGADPAAAGTGAAAQTARALGALLRIDSRYGQASKRLARLEHQLSGLRRAVGELDLAKQRLATPRGVRPQAKETLAQSPREKLERISAQLSEMKRVLRAAKRSGKLKKSEVKAIRSDLQALEARAIALQAADVVERASDETPKTDLSSLISQDQTRAVKLYEDANKLKSELSRQQIELAKDALKRFDLRASRLLRRARLGRIETVLGKKRALEIEIEALSQGLIPQTIVDSLDAARYLRDDEEYWPFDGEDWSDEYVGGENVR